MDAPHAVSGSLPLRVAYAVHGVCLLGMFRRTA